MVVYWVFDYIHVTLHVQKVRMFILRCMGLLRFGVRMFKDVLMLILRGTGVVSYLCTIITCFVFTFFCIQNKPLSFFP